MTSVYAPAQRRRHRLTAWGFVVSVAAGALLLTLWAAVWLPVYLANYAAQLFLFPLFMLAAIGISLLGASGAVVAIVSMDRHGRSRRAIAALVVGAAVALIAVPVMWFGGPAQSFG